MSYVRFDYQCTSCGSIVERDFRESSFTNPCDRCEDSGRERVQLYKRVYYSPNATRVWHGHYDMTTGEHVTDRKQIVESLHRKSEEVSERLNGPHNFIQVDPKDIYRGDKGLDTTHDAHVAQGLVESKGKFVFPMSTKDNSK